MKCTNNFITYLKWRGDLLIKDDPFNEVDALILSELAYIHFEDIVPKLGEEGAIRICDANARYEKSTVKEILYYVEKEELFDIVAQCPRFANMTLCNYVSTHDFEAQQQFAALHVNITPNLTFIAFRGTDSTVVGWREDFNMCYMMPVPAQQSAVDYVNRTAKGWLKKYCLGGHSKGGNLAVYSGVYCDSKIQKKIVKIYSFDGPGFNRKVVNDEAYKAVEKKIVTYVPQSSIVGMLMEHEEDYKVVKSEEFSLIQHEGFFWKVNRAEFELADEIDSFSKSFSVTFKTWLTEMSIQERKEIVDTFFNVFEDAGVVDLAEIAHMDVKLGASLIKAATKVPQKQRDKIGKLIKLLIEEATKK